MFPHRSEFSRAHGSPETGVPPAADDGADSGTRGSHYGPERRRRRRRPTRLPGWMYLDEAGRQQVHEVQMRNFSPDGAGFVSTQPLRKGQRLHLKIGLGPTRRPHPAEVAYTHRRDDGTWEVGVRFVSLPGVMAG